MTYHDPIVTITLVRGQFAVSLGEQGLMVKNWGKLKRALEKELSRPTDSRDDGHSGSCALADLLLDRLIKDGRGEEAGIASRPDSGPKECWPFEEAWF